MRRSCMKLNPLGFGAVLGFTWLLAMLNVSYHCPDFEPSPRTLSALPVHFMISQRCVLETLLGEQSLST